MERFVNKRYKVDLKDNDKIEILTKALNCKTRRDILRVLGGGPQSIWEISQALNVPLSTISEHVTILLKTEIVSVISKTRDRGRGKIIARQYEDILINIFENENGDFDDKKNYTVPLLIGSYNNFKINKYCGMVSETSYIERRDDPNIFYSSRRFFAQLLWFDYGFLEYIIPLKDIDYKKITSISVSLEICSESPGYNEDWKSDIFFEINNKEVCVYTAPGDYGARQGLLTPSWWKTGTQYGLMKHIKVAKDGTYLDGEKVSSVCLSELNLSNNNLVSLKFGVKENAKHRGGLNLFGSKFGDHNQHILFTVTYNK